MWVSRNIGVCLPTFWVFGWKTNTARVYTGCVPADARTQKQKKGLVLVGQASILGQDSLC